MYVLLTSVLNLAKKGCTWQQCFAKLDLSTLICQNLFLFLQLLLNHHQMSGLILLQQTVFAFSGIQYLNMRTTVIYLVILFAIIPLVITMEDGRTSVRQQQATLFQAFVREPDMIFGLLDSLWQELDRNPTGIFLHVRAPVLIAESLRKITWKLRQRSHLVPEYKNSTDTNVNKSIFQAANLSQNLCKVFLAEFKVETLYSST